MPVARVNDPMEGIAWLETEPRWKNGVGKDWAAKKVLGRGGQGIVGHWYRPHLTHSSPKRQNDDRST